MSKSIGSYDRRIFGRLPDHPPVSITWRGIRRRVLWADGPECVFGEWWRPDAELIAVRDYFRIEDDAGERFWIYRAGDGENAETGSHQWFLHGVVRLSFTTDVKPREQFLAQGRRRPSQTL